MLSLPLDRLLGSLGETLVMTAVSGAISFAVGLPFGLILVGTAPGAYGKTAEPTALSARSSTAFARCRSSFSLSR
jgi:ABC-type methionine transport system permease subunit